VENNVPVVGREEVRRAHEMHWIRIDRYYSDGEDGDLDIVAQPMMCQQCGHAPCEPVCPVDATTHSSEGINMQTYNRCVGTRYCANNCPYKVRRFNWFDYPALQGDEALALNPDVTVRTRGVMEKCNFCVQRVAEQKAESKRNGADIQDGDIKTACQQTCPAEAIVFGDINDPASRVSRLAKDARAFKVLEELGVRPSVTYLAQVRNKS
jgi:molybdopterin-containing oxidoreductase family iron-sulfur binding subunit